MAYTADQLAALEEAIASGNLRVRYADREVQYRDLSDMLRVRDLIRASLHGGTQAARRHVAAYRSGL